MSEVYLQTYTEFAMRKLILLYFGLVLTNCTSTPSYEREFERCVSKSNEILQSGLSRISYLQGVIADGYITKSRNTGRCLQPSKISKACLKYEIDVQYIPIDYTEYRRKLSATKSLIPALRRGALKDEKTCLVNRNNSVSEELSDAG